MIVGNIGPRKSNVRYTHVLHLLNRRVDNSRKIRTLGGCWMDAVHCIKFGGNDALSAEKSRQIRALSTNILHLSDANELQRLL